MKQPFQQKSAPFKNFLITPFPRQPKTNSLSRDYVTQRWDPGGSEAVTQGWRAHGRAAPTAPGPQRPHPPPEQLCSQVSCPLSAIKMISGLLLKAPFGAVGVVIFFFSLNLCVNQGTVMAVNTAFSTEQPPPRHRLELSRPGFGGHLASSFPGGLPMLQEC